MINNSSSDQEWDYQKFVESLTKLKSRIDEAISLLTKEEVAKNNVNCKVAEVLQEPISVVQDILDGLHLEIWK